MTNRPLFISDDSDFLYHHGVKGQKWGVSKRLKAGISAHNAKKDAKETARAKMYYGEGAGTRRKLIKAKVTERSKDPTYKKAYNKSLASQNMAKHASKAKRERHRNTTVKTTAKTGRGIINILNGNPMAASAAAVAVVGAYGVIKKTGLDKQIYNAGKSAYNTVKTEFRAQEIKRQFKDAGWG